MRSAWALLLLAACTGEPTTAQFSLPAEAREFYDLPYPNDLRRDPATDALDLSLFPVNAPLVDQFRAAAQELDGFGLNAAIYARLDGGVDETTLPTPEQSVQDDAAVYLVNISAGTPRYGERIPIVVRYKPTGTQTIGDTHLVARPYPGFPLAERATYALVVTTRLVGDNGEAIRVAPGYAELERATSGLDWEQSKYAPLWAWLDEAGGDSRADVATAAVFTTQTATAIAPAIRAAIYALPAPTAADVMSPEPVPNSAFRTITGTYSAPNFQAGDVPYKNAPAGRITLAAPGMAAVQRMEPMRFMLTVPTTQMPANGWPICLYQHGTGGDWTSFIGDGTAIRLAREGIAVISTDQVLHGPRNPGGNPELDFFNFGNVYAARDNALQGAADAWSQLRLVTDAALDAGGTIHRFDADKVVFFGHSQGGNTGPAFVAFEPTLKGAVLSGTAGLLYENLLHKTEPLNIPDLVTTFIRDEPVDEDNPTLALVQMWIERSDSINYAPLMVREPPAGNAAKAIYQSEGFTDLYSPNIGIEAFATALGGDIVDLVGTQDVPGLTSLRGRQVVPPPITNNVNGVTAVLAQYDQRPGSDGHFVVFDIPAANTHSSKFLGTLLTTGQATVVRVP